VYESYASRFTQLSRLATLHDPHRRPTLPSRDRAHCRSSYLVYFATIISLQPVRSHSKPQLSSLLVCCGPPHTTLVVVRSSEKSLAAMIRRGRAEGWLRQPIDVLPRWASFHGVKFNHVKIGPLPGYEDRGSTVIADQKLVGGSVEPLLIVPKELIISRRNIDLFSKSDHHLREILEALGDFGRV
jgi:hypothetical protein